MTTYTPVRRLFYPRFGIVVADGVGRRTFWFGSRRAMEAEMARIQRAANAERATR